MRKNMRGIWISGSKVRLCSALVWFCRIYCKEENFFMILSRGLFRLSYSLLFCFYFVRLYAKINLLSAESSFTFFTCKMHLLFTLY